MKKLITLLLIISISMLIFSVAGFAQQTFVDIATGGTGGTYFPVGGAIANILTNNVENLSATAQTSNASVTNLNYLLTGRAETGICQSNLAYWAYEGVVLFEDKDPFEGLRGIASLYPETIHVVALAGKGIETIDDLEGKRVSVGAPNSGNEADARIYLPAHGVEYEDLSKLEYLSMAESAQAFADGQIDAWTMTTGYPSSSVMDSAAQRDIVLVQMHDEVMEELVEKYPYYAKEIIPGGTYQDIPEDTPTLATPCWWLCTEDMDEELVYQMTKALWENHEEIAKAHAQGKNITPDTALNGQPVPLHAGAERYYKEAGILK